MDWSFLGLVASRIMVSRFGCTYDWSFLGLVILGLVVSRIGHSRNGRF
jgi:hypothetical protein